MRRHNSILTLLLLVCFCSILMTTMLISVSYYDTHDIGPDSGLRNFPGVIPNQETLIEMGLFENGGIGNGSKLISFTQSEGCQKNCNLSIPISTSGKLPTWPSRNLLNSTQKTKYTAFRQTISSLEYDLVIELLTVFRLVCEQNNLTYMLYGGTLLGAYRHFGLVPWDDDVDVMVNSSDRLQLKHVLSRVPGYSIDTPHGRQWKFFKTSLNDSILSSRRTEKDTTKIDRDREIINESIALNKKAINESDSLTYNHSWPYIDIFFFEENSTHIWDYNPSYTSTYCFDKTDVFPLKYMQFEKSLSPVPRHTRTFLTTSYNVDLCVTSTYSHKLETSTRLRQVSLPCRRLYKYLPFVFRVCGSGYSFEKLVINNRSLYATLLKC